MSAHYKAFIVVFVVSLLALIFFQRPFSEALGKRRFNNYRNLWMAYIVMAFFITNYWFFLGVSFAILFVMTRTESVKPALYLLLFAAVPGLGDYLQGFAFINRFILVTPQLILLLLFIIPVMLSHKQMQKVSKVGAPADFIFLMYLLLSMGIALREASITHTIRTALETALTMAPLYWVFSRYPKSLDSVRTLTAAFLLPIVVLSVTTIPELLRSWHFYNHVTTAWFGAIPFSYTPRAGLLRSSASLFNPINWGLFAMVAIGLGLGLFNDKFSKNYRNIGLAILAFGLFASLSRGPWMGAIVIVFVFVALSQKAVTRLFQLGALGSVAFLISLATPFGQKILALLPFVGSYASNTITYRQRLMDAAWDVMLENPFFGSQNFWGHPKLQAMRQGQGIIDIVNTYLLVGLSKGFVGIALFGGMFIAVSLTLRKAMKSARRYDPTMELYCRAYLATIMGMAVAICTTSSNQQVPLLFWSLLGLGVGLARVERVSGQEFEEKQLATRKVEARA